MSGVLAAFEVPYIDYHALAPEIIITATFVVLVVVDVISVRNRALAAPIAGVGLLAAMVPILTLAISDDET
jgi:hypothetical protein